MRTLTKALRAGALLSTAMLLSRACVAQPLAVQGSLTDANAPNTTWRLFTVSVQAGDTFRVTWKGVAHIQLRLYDRLSGQAIRDSTGTAVTATYVGGTSLFGSSALTLTSPVAAPDAILVVKNTDAVTGQTVFSLYTYNAVTSVPPPQPFIYRMSYVHDLLAGIINATFTVVNTNSLPAQHIRTDIMILRSFGSTPALLLDTSLNGFDLAPGVWTSEDFTMPEGSVACTVQASNTTYGERYVANFNFLVQ